MVPMHDWMRAAQPHVGWWVPVGRSLVDVGRDGREMISDYVPVIPGYAYAGQLCMWVGCGLMSIFNLSGLPVVVVVVVVVVLAPPFV